MTQTYFIPDKMRVYAIGDIHGMAKMLDHMHEEIAIDLVKHPVEHPVIVYLGDYIDRGDENSRVIEILAERQNMNDGVEKHFLMGNHEDAVLNFMDDPHAIISWLEYGGIETIRDYGIEFDKKIASEGDIEDVARKLKAAVPPSHLAFLRSLDVKLEIGDYIFVHAGIHPQRRLEDQKRHDLLMIREPFLSYGGPFPKRVVHGHTPVKTPDIRHNRLNMDTGAVYGGALSCAVLESDQTRVLQVNN